MCIEISYVAVLVHWILLDVEAGRIYVRAEYIDPVHKGLRTDLKEYHGFVHPHAVDLVAGR